MALLALGLVAIVLVGMDFSPILARKPYSAAKIPGAGEPQVVEAYGNLPLSFEANQGQTDSQVDFLSRGSGYTLFLTPAEAVLALRKPAASSRARTTHAPPGNTEAELADAVPPVVVRMKLVGANPSPRVTGLEELPGKSNYFLGNDPDKWRTNVPHYAKVQYKDVCPGVDLVYYGNQHQLEYDLVVGPGADPDAITLSFEGVEKLRIDAQGDLVLETADGEIRQHKPLVYQEVDDIRREIMGSYVLKGHRQVAFEVAAYDASKPLIIDPVLVYSTYLGGSADDASGSIAVDTSGNAYVTGRTDSTDFPTASPIQSANAGSSDAFVTKLNAAGSALVYSTYLGGSGAEVVVIVGIDASGNAYVMGQTDSTDFPTVNPFQAANAGGEDAFVFKIGPTITVPPCTYAISPTTASFPASGGTGSVLVSTRCGWNAKSDVSWITITSGSSGGGTGRVEYSVEANPDPGSRIGTLTITGGQILTVTQAGTVEVPPALTVGPRILGFSATVGDPPARQGFQIGSDGGPVNWTATVRLLNGSGWLTISPSSGAASLTQPAVVIATVNCGALGGAGVFQAEITVTDTATGSSVTVQVTVVLSAPVARLALSQTAFVFQGVTNCPPPPQNLTVFNAGTGTLNWSLAGLPPWLTASPQSGTVGAGSSSVVTLTANLTGLASGVFQALVTASAPGASGNPQLVSMTLNVVPTSTSASADLSPNGLWFVAEPGVTLQQSGTVPGAQDLTVNNTGGGTLTADFVTATSSGGEWLMVSPSSGTASGGPFPTQVSVNPVGLAPGVYRGTVDGSFSSSGPQEVEVLLIVTPPGTSLQTQSGLPGATQCAPSGLQLLSTTIGSGLSLPVSFPRVLTALVVDDCGSTVDNATLVASVEGLNIPLRGLGTGLYSGTWVPQSAAAEVTVTFAALHPDFAQVQRSFTVETAAAPGAISLPALFADGVVEGAGFTKRRPLSPGGIVSLFGERFATENNFATQLPLERELAEVSVRIGGQDAPLYFVSPGQINAQVPFEVSTGDSVPVAISVGGLLTAPQNYLIAPAQPGIFIAGENAAILDASFQLVTAQNPVRAGDTIQIFATGLGETDPEVGSGEPAPPFSTVSNPVTVTIGGIEAAVAFQGLAPGFVGLYQVNVVVPSGVAPGDAVPLVLTQNGIVANPDLRVTIPVQAP